MKLLPLLALALTLPLHADFSYKSTRKTGGAMASVMGNRPPQVSTYYYKGQKLKVDNGTSATIMDFGARTVTTINKTAKTVTVKTFQDLADAASKAKGVEAQIDVKETGQKKNVNGFDASEAILTMNMEMDSPPQARQPGKMQMQMEMDMWIASGVPGAEQLWAFHEKNAADFPYSAMGGADSASIGAAMADAQRKIASMHGIPIEQTMRIKSMGAAGASGAPAMPAMTPAQTAQMAKARAQMEAMIAQGGPGAAMAKQALDRMGAMGTAGPAGSSGAMMEVTMDASDFSSAAIPDSVFDVPADYKKAN